MKTSLFTFIAILSIGFSALSQDKKISEADKEKYIQIIYEKCVSADILVIESKEEYVEIEYLCEGRYFEMGIKNHEILFIESNADKASFPIPKIEKKISKKYADWLLDEISLIETKDTSFLKVEIMKDGLEQNLFFTTEGKWYRSTSLVVSDQWTLKKLNSSKLYNQADYPFLAPQKILNLPDILREVSGIVLSADERSVFCIQDELGAVFHYDLIEEKMKNIHRFTDVGDFEEITRKKDELYVLRSDGKVFHFSYKQKEKINSFMMSINALNFESLTYNQKKKKFLTVSKDALINEQESIKTVYSFLGEKPSDTDVLINVDLQKMRDKVKTFFPNNKEIEFVFQPSSIAVHPITSEIYILSADDRIVSIYNKEGLKKCYLLPAEIYYKPEGLAFFENGDLIISNEGSKNGLVKGNLVFLNYKSKLK